MKCYRLLGCSVLWILSLLSWAFDCSASSLHQKCRGYEVSGVLMSNSLVHLCDSNLSECLIGWWLTGLLSFVDCTLILVVVGKVLVVGFLVVVAFWMFVGWVPVVEDNDESRGFIYIILYIYKSNKRVGVLPIQIVQSNVSSIGPLSERNRKKNFLFLSDEGPMLETLDYTIRIGGIPTLLFDLYLFSAYTAHYVYIYCIYRYLYSMYIILT